MDDRETLLKAIEGSRLAELNQLLEAGVETNFWWRAESPLTAAACANNLEAMALLLDFGADVNFPDEDGWTALHHAVDFSIDSSIQAGLSPGDESVDAIHWLVQHGANPDARTNEDETPLDFARSYRSDRVEQVLLTVQT